MQVKIHYHRPPDRTTIFENELVHTSDDVIVTVMRATPLNRPIKVNDKTILEDGAPAIWFTFPGRSYDVGRFHTRERLFTGIYANILTPVEFVSSVEWRTTDLFVDVWLDAAGTVQVLDEDELSDAVNAGWLSTEVADRARQTAYELISSYQDGTWPPQVVYDWPLERILR